MVHVVWAIVIIVCFVTCAFFMTISPITNNLRTWCETRKYLSDNKKEIELRRLEVLEKTPELRQLIFHPKEIEKENK